MMMDVVAENAPPPPVVPEIPPRPPGFPPTLVYSWTPQKTALEDVTALTTRMALLSTTHTMPWSVEITSKFPLQKKKQLVAQSSSSSSSSSSNARPGSNNKHPPTAAASDDVALNFVAFTDIQLCAVVPRAKKTPGAGAVQRKPLALHDVDVVGLTHGCEDAWLKSHGKKETEWTTRASWRCSGTRFLYADTYLVSVGFVEHAGAPPRPCMEVTHVPAPHEADGGDGDGGEGDATAAPPRVVAQLHRVASDLLASVARDDVLPGLAGSAETGNACLAQTVASRAAQWVSVL